VARCAPATRPAPACRPQAVAYLAALCHAAAVARGGSSAAAAAAASPPPPPLPHLAVVPLSTLPHWQREFARFAPQLNVVALSGNAQARAVVKEYELFGRGLGAPHIHVAGAWVWACVGFCGRCCMPLRPAVVVGGEGFGAG
jgi:hypothetical protein